LQPEQEERLDDDTKPPLLLKAKADIFLLTCSPSQRGQQTASPARMTIFSNS
jgi:hypothetical protein